MSRGKLFTTLEETSFSYNIFQKNLYFWFYTYMFNWLRFQPFSQDYWPSFSMLFYTCVMGPTVLKSTLNDRFFEKLSMAILFTLIAFARNLLRGNRRKKIFLFFILMSDLGSNPGFMSNEPTHYPLDYGDFKSWSLNLKICIKFHQSCGTS